MDRRTCTKAVAAGLAGVLLTGSKQTRADEQTKGDAMQPFMPLKELPFSASPIVRSEVPAAVNSLLIGAIFPFTGAIGKLGADSFDGANAALQLINDRGGVNGRPVEWVVSDGFSPDEAARQVERMIQRTGVRFIIGGTGSGQSIAVSRVCERHGVVFWVQNSWTSDLFAHHPKYTFRPNVYAALVEAAAVDYVVKQIAPNIQPSHLRVAVINENGPYGVSCAVETVKALAAVGISPLIQRPYDGSADDLSDFVRVLKEADVQVIFASSLIHDSIVLMKAIRKASFQPKAIMTSSAGFGLYTLLEAGDVIDGVFSANAPAHVSPRALNRTGRDLFREYSRRLKANTGREPTAFNAQGFVAAYSLLHDVLPNAKDINDPASVRNAAISADVPIGTYPNGWGLKFNETGQNQRLAASIDQWQSESLVTVAPTEISLAPARTATAR
jgi:branched-chain amino acid transport system substrate-binding protein